MKLWTLTKNTEDGIATSIYLTEGAASAAKTECLKTDWDAWFAGEFPGAEQAASELGDSVGYLDSYDLEKHTLPDADVLAALATTQE